MAKKTFARGLMDNIFTCNFFSLKLEKTMAKSIPDLLASVRQMLVGLEANADVVAARGATPAFTQNGQSLLDSVNTLEAE
jgi:hypothetical protein